MNLIVLLTLFFSISAYSQETKVLNLTPDPIPYGVIDNSLNCEYTSLKSFGISYIFAINPKFNPRTYVEIGKIQRIGIDNLLILKSGSEYDLYFITGGEIFRDIDFRNNEFIPRVNCGLGTVVNFSKRFHVLFETCIPLPEGIKDDFILHFRSGVGIAFN